MTARRLATLLVALVVVLAVAVVVGGVLVQRERDDRAETVASQERYGDVVASARAFADAFSNLDYRDLDASTEAVSSRATGDFLSQYESSIEPITSLMSQAQPVLTQEVLTASVSSIDRDSAVVLVSTAGDVQSKASSGRDVKVAFRYQLGMVLQDGDWLVNELKIYS